MEQIVTGIKKLALAAYGLADAAAQRLKKGVDMFSQRGESAWSATRSSARQACLEKSGQDALKRLFDCPDPRRCIQAAVGKLNTQQRRMLEDLLAGNDRPADR